MTLLENQAPIAVVLGPTASGKSAVAMALAKQIDIEIVSVDSAQVYRGMDIGTAKASPEELARVPHHLIDIVDPANAYSAARFVQDASDAIVAIRERGNTPLLVGGTMLYAKSLIEGLNKLPAANPEIRTQLDAEAANIGWQAMHQRLGRVDPVTAARLEPADAQRVQRALEVFEVTGSPMSTLLAAENEPSPGENSFITFALEPSDRLQLHQHIAARFHTMMNSGFIDEVNTLRQRNDLHPGLPSIRCVGYRQLWNWFDAGADQAGLSAAIESGIASTRQLAKRQLTWLRSMPQRRIVDCSQPDAVDTAVRLIVQTLESQET